MTKPSPIALATLLACLASTAIAQQAAQPASAPASAAEHEALPEIKVRGARSKETAVAPVKGYVAKRSATAAKTDTPLIETPQAITVVTRDAIEEQGAMTAAETVRYTAGVNSAYFDSRVDSFQLRGGNPAQYLDGLLRTSGSYNTTRPDPYTLERVEILRGPSSMLYGQGGIGGVLNMVSKRPQKTAQRELQVQLGTHDRRQLAADMTGPLNEEATWLYRLVAVSRESGSQVDYVPDDRTLFAPSLTWAPNDDTEVVLQALYQKDKSGSLIEFFPWKGTLYANPNGPIPFNTFISEPGFDRYDTEQTSLGYQASHRLNPNWAVRQNLRISRSDVDYRTMYTSFTANAAATPPRPGRPVFDNNGRTVQRDIAIQFNSAALDMVDTQVEGKFRTGLLDHTLLMGIDGQQAKVEQSRGSSTSTGFDVYAPVYGLPFTMPVVTAQPDSMLRQLGSYVQDQIKWGKHWVTPVGVRYDWAKTEVEGKPQQSVKTSAASKRVGLLYLADNGWAPYVSYSESFTPLTGTNSQGNAFKPQRGNQWEAGVKYQPADSRAMYTLAIYDLHDKNRKTADAATPTLITQIGEVHVKGLELEARGALTSQVEWIGNYAYTDAKVGKSLGRLAISDQDGNPLGSVAEEGVHLSGTPKHMASTWLTYSTAFGGGRIKVGSGVRYTGSSTDGTDRNEVPDVTLVDAMVSYNVGDLRLALNVNNLTDKAYLTTCLARGDCFLGQRRTVVASAAYRF